MAQLRARVLCEPEDFATALRQLEGAICIAVQDEEHADSPAFQDEPLPAPQPPVGELVYARPFAAFENHYKITVDGRQDWYAECAVEACAISGQFPGKEVTVSSLCRQTGQTVQLTGKDGVLLDYSPSTLRVHLGYPLREMPHRVVGWCDYNSFFASEEAARRWQREHPDIAGVTQSPEEMARLITELLGVGRLTHDYQPELPVLDTMRNLRRWGLLRRSRPYFFWMPTPAMVRDWRRAGLGNHFRFRVARRYEPWKGA